MNEWVKLRPRIRRPKLSPKEEAAEVANCEVCQSNPHAKGMCHKHYMRLWIRAKKDLSKILETDSN